MFKTQSPALMAHRLALLALLVAALHAGAAHSQPLLSVPFTGWYNDATATFYGGPQDSAAVEYDAKISTGSCGYGDIDPKLWPFYLVAGLSPANPLIQGLKQHGCGSCLEIECVGAHCHSGVGPVQALLTDECANRCTDSQVNLHVFGFEMLAPTDVGTISVRYRLVACTPVDPITIHVDAYRVSEGGWLRFALKNVGGDGQISAVELAPAAATDLNQSSTNIVPSFRGPRSLRRQGMGLWRSANNTYGAAWELNGVPPPPLHMRITNARGQTIIVANAIPRAGVLGDIETHAQFPQLPLPAGADGSPAAPLVPPPGAYLAPGTPNVLIFQGPDPDPLAAPADPADGNATQAGNVTAPGTPAVGAGAGAAPNASTKGADAAGDGGQYTVAGFNDADGDGIPDPAPVQTGMPAAPVSPTPAAAPVASPTRAAGYVPAPADAGGPGRRLRKLLSGLRAPALELCAA